jgi:hypothetical protein
MKTALKLKKKHVAGVSRTFYLSTETNIRPPQSRETIPLSNLHSCIHVIKKMLLQTFAYRLCFLPLLNFNDQQEI